LTASWKMHWVSSKSVDAIMLNYDEDIVSIATDGASVMQKVERLSNYDQ
jgi:hypothetical protein